MCDYAALFKQGNMTGLAIATLVLTQLLECFCLHFLKLSQPSKKCIYSVTTPCCSNNDTSFASVYPPKGYNGKILKL